MSKNVMRNCGRCIANVGGVCRVDQCHGSVSGTLRKYDTDTATVAREQYEQACEALGMKKVSGRR